MKICIVGDFFYPYVGGIETTFFETAEGLSRRGHEVRVVTSAIGEYCGRKNLSGIDVYYYPWKKICGHPLVRTRNLKEHIQWADVVYAGPYMSAFSAVRIAQKYEKPIAYYLVEVLGDRWNIIESNPVKAHIFRCIESVVAKQKYDFIQAISIATKRDYDTFIKKETNVQVIYPFLTEDYAEAIASSSFDLKKYFGLEKSKKAVLYYGRPGKSKGLFVYLDALLKFANKYGIDAAGEYRFCFILAKEPHDTRNQFVREVEKTGLRQIIAIRDSLPRNDLLKGISQSDIVVVPSITEGFGLSAGEACMLGRKILYSDAGSLPEVVSGSTVSFRNRDSDDLCEKLFRICQNEDIFQTTPKKYFPKEEMIRKLEEAFYTLCE